MGIMHDALAPGARIVHDSWHGASPRCHIVTDSMRNIRIRILNDHTREALESCKRLTGEATAAGAVLQVIRKWPALHVRVAALEEELAREKAKAAILKDSLEAHLFGGNMETAIAEAVDEGLARREAQTPRKPEKRPALHFAAAADGRYHRACNSKTRYRLPNCDTDTDVAEDVTCIRCRNTLAWHNATRVGQR